MQLQFIYIISTVQPYSYFYVSYDDIYTDVTEIELWQFPHRTKHHKYLGTQLLNENTKTR